MDLFPAVEALAAGWAGLCALDVTDTFSTYSAEDRRALGRNVFSFSPDANESLSGNTTAITIFIEIIN